MKSVRNSFHSLTIRHDSPPDHFLRLVSEHRCNPCDVTVPLIARSRYLCAPASSSPTVRSLPAAAVATPRNNGDPAIADLSLTCVGKFAASVSQEGLNRLCTKVLKPMQRSLNENNILAQRRKDAKKRLRNAVALCAFAPLRERFFSVELLFVQSCLNQHLQQQNVSTPTHICRGTFLLAECDRPLGVFAQFSDGELIRSREISTPADHLLRPSTTAHWLPIEVD
jgi:hypothetical protein